jgi:hypothetical protein
VSQCASCRFLWVGTIFFAKTGKMHPQLWLRCSRTHNIVCVRIHVFHISKMTGAIQKTYISLQNLTESISL